MPAAHPVCWYAYGRDSSGAPTAQLMSVSTQDPAEAFETFRAACAACGAALACAGRRGDGTSAAPCGARSSSSSPAAMSMYALRRAERQPRNAERAAQVTHKVVPALARATRTDAGRQSQQPEAKGLGASRSGKGGSLLGLLCGHMAAMWRPCGWSQNRAWECCHPGPTRLSCCQKELLALHHPPRGHSGTVQSAASPGSTAGKCWHCWLEPLVTRNRLHGG